jgi:hypothetical protein
MPTKVNSPWTNSRLPIALHSPSALCETGLRVCPPEKSRDGDPVLSGAVRSLQSGLLRKNREKWATFAYFGGKDRGISLQLRLAGGASVIRTRVTVLGPATSDVCVTCRWCST